MTVHVCVCDCATVGVFRCRVCDCAWVHGCGSAGVPVRVRVCRCVSVQVCECAGVRVCRCANVQVRKCECAGVRVCRGTGVSVQVCECTVHGIGCVWPGLPRMN